MEQYLSILLSQVRYKKAHSMIEKELRCHLEEEIEHNIKSGMEREEAEEEAVKDMGNPIDVGIALDAIHRPISANKIIAILLTMSIASVAVQIWMTHTAMVSAKPMMIVAYTIVGVILMLGMYYMDYSFLVCFGKKLAAVILIIILFAMVDNKVMALGGSYYCINLNCIPIDISLHSLVMLYVPLYSSVIYRWYGTDVSGVIKSVCWMLIPVVMLMIIGAVDLAVLVNISLSLVLWVAIWKNWFGILKSHKNILSIAIWMYNILLLFVTQYMQRKTESGRMLATNILVLMKPDYNSIYSMIFIIAVGCIVVTVFCIAFVQKNQFGSVLCVSCGCVLFSNLIMYILHSVNLVNFSSAILPFFTYGGSFLIVCYLLMCYLLMGLVLSTYRYKNIYNAF